jgi:hypothetical protein
VGRRWRSTKIVRVERAYLAGSRALSAILCLVGATLLVTTLVRGGGPLALGVVMGVLFCALGAARLWLARQMSPDRGA